MLLYKSRGTKTQMKACRLLALLIPLTALSGCSYNGEHKPLQDGDFLVRDSYEVRHDTFEELNQHVKSNDTFTVYFSLPGCSACERFEEGFKEVSKETKILTLHYEYGTDATEINQIFINYPTLQSEESPAFFLMNGSQVEQMKYAEISNATKLRNKLKRTVSLSNHYFFSKAADYSVALSKTNFKEATVVEFNPTNSDQVSSYRKILDEDKGLIFIRHNQELETISVSKISK